MPASKSKVNANMQHGHTVRCQTLTSDTISWLALDTYDADLHHKQSTWIKNSLLRNTLLNFNPTSTAAFRSANSFSLATYRSVRETFGFHTTRFLNSRTFPECYSTEKLSRYISFKNRELKFSVWIFNSLLWRLNNRSQMLHKSLGRQRQTTLIVTRYRDICTIHCFHIYL